ncbi:MAG: transporter permease [Frankiales bacterium]|jgi:peptide/nickel transport system permease protein|nr:transporter permease [Frankiales bacterium]MCW2585692.1 transporter permease [Frankiales bacterium]
MSIAESEARLLSTEHTGDIAGSRMREAFRQLRRNPVAILGAALITLFVVVAVFAPWLAPHSPTAGDLSQITLSHVPGPSAEHPLGLDTQGRDELSRIIYGARASLLIGVVSLSLGALVGMLIGALAGGLGGWVDSLLMRLMDIMLAVPGLLFAIAVAAVLQPSLRSVMIAIAVVNVPVFARLLRASMIGQRHSDYVLAARSIGVRRWRIIVGHVLPNSLAPVIVQGTLSLATAIIDAAGLAFLGLGSADPSVPEWGRMLADTQQYLQSAPQLALFPGLAIVVSVLGFNLLGDALREALDPKLRR